jgi:hypothetical protein
MWVRHYYVNCEIIFFTKLDTAFLIQCKETSADVLFKFKFTLLAA